MNKEDSTVVITFPIGVRSETTKIGLMVSAAIAQVVSNKLDAKFILALNTLDSWVPNRNQYVKHFLNSLNNAGINPDSVWIDEAHRDSLIDSIRQLLSKRIVTERERIIFSCQCKKVTILEGTPLHQNARLYSLNGTTAICLQCKTECSPALTPSLVLKPNNLGLAPHTIPVISEKRLQEKWNTINNMEYLISRNRDTGLCLETDQKHFLDIDSVWLQYLTTIKATKFVLVGSNHVAWHLALAASYLRMHNGSADISVILTPYLDGEVPGMINQLQCDDLPLYIILSTNWGRHESVWSSHLIKWINKQSKKTKELLWKNINLPVSSTDNLQRIIHDLSPQRLIQSVQLRRK